MRLPNKGAFFGILFFVFRFSLAVSFVPTFWARIKKKKKLFTLYIGILFLNLASAQTKISDTIMHDGNSGISIYDFIEYQKGLMIQDSSIKTIRMMNPFCMSEHGETFDNYDCKTYLDKEQIRHHSYGMLMGKFRYNDDKYYKNGKLIKWIKAEELIDDPTENYKVKIHIYEVPLE